MNEWVIRFGWLAGQVTLLSLAAAGLCLLTGRRSPSAGASVALTGLGGVVVLTLLAVVPLPAWWSWATLLQSRPVGGLTADEAAVLAGAGSTPPGGDRERAPARPRAARSERSDAGAAGWDLGELGRLWGQLAPALRGIARHNPACDACVVGLVLAGMCWSLARLLGGLYAVHCACARSRPVRDATLLALLARLCQAMACRRPVQVREAEDVGGPVTVGWRRPVVLLPPGWRCWEEAELMAVLAHEIAHVCRADYAAWIVARLGVALHGYHPLVHWLAGRLQLQQECAADALGAGHAGGRRVYLRSLARLALRQDEAVAAAPARAFLPVRGTLLRRIAMLQAERKPVRWPLPRGLALLLAGVAILGASALRGAAQADATPSGSSVAAEAAATPVPQPATRRAPFAYCIWSPEAAGLFAFRPAAFFGSDPRMREHAADADLRTSRVLQVIGAPQLLPRLEEIDEVSGAVFLKTVEKSPRVERCLILGTTLTFRTVGPHDWHKAIASIAHQVTEVSCEGRTCYKIAHKDFKNPEFFGPIAASVSGEAERSLHFYLPDDRTLVIGSEQQLRELIRQGPYATPAWAMAAGWEQVERGVFAVALTNQDQRLARICQVSPPEEVPADVSAAVARTTGLVVGIDHQGELRTDLLAGCASRKDAVAVADTLLRYVRKGQTMVEATTAQAQLPGLGLLRELLDQTRVNLEGGDKDGPALVHAQARVKKTFADVVESLTSLAVRSVEVKQK